MSIPRGFQGLHFPCECVSAVKDNYSDPWAEIARRKLLPNGTKEEILNLVSQGPKTISQLAEALELTAPSVHTHVNDLMKSELLRESVEWEKQYPTERYYEPNFPVFKARECAEFMSLCDEMAEQVAAIFERKRAKLDRAFRKTNLEEQGWEFSDVTQCLYANMQRHARMLLEQRGLLNPRQKHENGAAWVFWAQEPLPSK
ncbi:MAG TPA: winged helix-turn-helix domain-containing protein [Pyrinomonadaceae bacterium]|jgi:DNA-binding transcriptional ArsR family regulator